MAGRLPFTGIVDTVAVVVSGSTNMHALARDQVPSRTCEQADGWARHAGP